ncbi:MAG: GGDEF domain-containing protein, partial [Thermocrispum sp.]
MSPIDLPVSPKGRSVLAVDAGDGSPRWDLSEKYAGSALVAAAGDYAVVMVADDEAATKKRTLLIDVRTGREVAPLGTTDSCASDTTSVMVCVDVFTLQSIALDAGEVSTVEAEHFGLSVDAVWNDYVFMGDVDETVVVDTAGGLVSREPVAVHRVRRPGSSPRRRPGGAIVRGPPGGVLGPQGNVNVRRSPSQHPRGLAAERVMFSPGRATPSQAAPATRRNLLRRAGRRPRMHGPEAGGTATVPATVVALPLDTGAAPASDLVTLHESIARLLAVQGNWKRAYSHLNAALRLARDAECATPIVPEQYRIQVAELRRAHAEAVDASLRDALTASYNRRYLDQRLATLLAEHTSGGASPGIAVVLVDLDLFKGINDEFGHLLG